MGEIVNGVMNQIENHYNQKRYEIEKEGEKFFLKRK